MRYSVGMPTARGLMLVLLAALLLAGPPSRAWGQASPPAPGGVLVTAGRVSARLVSAPLRTVLREIASQTRIEIMILGKGEQHVTASFEDVPVEVAIRTLMRGNGGGAFVFEENAAGERRLVGAYVTIDPGGPGMRDEATMSAQAQPRSPEGSAPAATPPPASKEPASIASHEDVLRTGAIEDFVPAAVALFPGVGKPVDAVYAAATRHPDANVRLNALSVIAEVGSGEAARRALEQAANDLDPTVQARAKQMLGKPGATVESPVGLGGR